jgi:cyclin-dependent kinase-like
MENYVLEEKIGEGTYGEVFKARHLETGKQVAIKKFKDNYDDEYVRKTALREIRILKELKHDHIVNLIEVFRDQGKILLVFEYVDRTVLDEIENSPNGLDEMGAKKIIWQLLRSVAFIHDHNIIHRDIKPENLLLSKNGVLKMCDFGFARPLVNNNQDYTDYVSTRWYRAPELLIGDQNYGKAIDVWAIGCLYAEIITGEPLFPGDSDIQTLYLILQIFGDQLNEKHKKMILKNPAFKHIKIDKIEDDLDRKFKSINADALDLLKKCLVMDPAERQDCNSLLTHQYFEDFNEAFEEEIQQLLELDSCEFNRNILKNTS